MPCFFHCTHLLQQILPGFCRAFPIILLCLFLTSTQGLALEAPALEPMLQLPALSLEAGQTARFSVYFHNRSDRIIDNRLPAELVLIWQPDNGTRVSLQAREVEASTPTSVRPGMFRIKSYALQLPVSMSGLGLLSILDAPQSALLARINPPPAGSPPLPIAASDSAESGNTYPTLESLFSLYQHYTANFSAYQPMYFLVGARPEDSKFQLSLKYRPFNPAGTLSQRHPWLQGVFFAYTQTSFWDLESDSAPFQDTSYKPEIFFLTDNIRHRPNWLAGLFLQAGLQHESNGQGGQVSRSTNNLYLKPTMIFFDPSSKMGLRISPKLLAYVNNDDDNNPDLDDYRGHLELEIKFGKATGLVSATRLRFAERGVSFQTDLTYPISELLGRNLDIYFQIEYVDALAESLLKYQQRNRALRFGFAIVR